MITKRLGELLIEQGLISQEQLDEALEMQKMYPDQTVGQLLCRLGYIRESDLSLVLDQKNKRRKLADILLKELPDFWLRALDILGVKLLYALGYKADGIYNIHHHEDQKKLPPEQRKVKRTFVLSDGTIAKVV